MIDWDYGVQEGLISFKDGIGKMLHPSHNGFLREAQDCAKFSQKRQGREMKSQTRSTRALRDLVGCVQS